MKQFASDVVVCLTMTFIFFILGFFFWPFWILAVLMVFVLPGMMAVREFKKKNGQS